VYFDTNGKFISGSDMHKSQNLSNYDAMTEKQNRLCKGKCIQFKAKKPLTGGRYEVGQCRCQTCDIYLTEQGVDGNSCKCCNFRVRRKPRNSLYKERYEEKVRNAQEPWIKQESNDEDWLLEESTKERIKHDSEDGKKSTPIYEEIDESVKTYYELKDFLKSEIKLQANYQFVMLKELLDYGRLHKGEIAESLAYFNNKDSSDINSVKYYFDVPVYDVLLKHGFVTMDDHFNVSYYSLNVKIDGFQKIELIDYFTNAIAKYNEEHNIPENEYPNANNMGSIDWTYSNIPSMSKVQKIKNIVKKTGLTSIRNLEITSIRSSWIWSVTPENWEIVKSKNVWGSRIPKERIGLKVLNGDQVAFYVIGSNCFKGIFEFVGKWYDSPGKTWDDDLEPDGSLRYKSQIKLTPIQLGSVNVHDLYEKMELFIGKPQNIRNLILQGGGGYPSNNSRSLLKEDFETIKHHLTQNPSISEPKVEETTTTIVKECPQCHLIINGEENSSYFNNLIEEKFGFRQMITDDPTSKVPQSYCRKCRKAERTFVEEGKTDLEHLTVFDSEVDGINIKHYDLQDSETIKKGQNLTNDELVAKFGVGNMGGIRYSSKSNVIVLCDTASGHYTDVIDKEFQIIYYTGEGKFGDQSLTAGNQRIVESENTPMFYFVEVPQEPGQNKRGALGKIYRFVGKIRYLKYTTKTENDINGTPRKVIKFLLEVEK